MDMEKRGIATLNKLDRPWQSTLSSLDYSEQMKLCIYNNKNKTINLYKLLNKLPRLWIWKSGE